jgi:putative spermidine/putrescine transport system ATP-binding protein
VGVSNVLEGDAARTVSGSSEAFTIRPEKIRLGGAEERAVGDECAASGHVREVVYLGALTRYTVDLDGGGTLVVTRQNLDTSSMEALQAKGRAVMLIWDRRHNRRVETGGIGLGGPEGGDA